MRFTYSEHSFCTLVCTLGGLTRDRLALSDIPKFSKSIVRIPLPTRILFNSIFALKLEQGNRDIGALFGSSTESFLTWVHRLSQFVDFCLFIAIRASAERHCGDLNQKQDLQLELPNAKNSTYTLIEHSKYTYWILGILFFKKSVDN